MSRPTAPPAPRIHTRNGPGSAERRVGYALSIVATVALFWVANVWPGWDAVPFLTPRTTEVLSLFNLSLAAGIAVNVIYLLADPPWVRAIGEFVTLAVGLSVAVRLWTVYPFDYTAMTFDGDLLTRLVLVIAIGGSIIGLIVQVVVLSRFGPGRAS